jgi:hypothetical protein
MVALQPKTKEQQNFAVSANHKQLVIMHARQVNSVFKR